MDKIKAVTFIAGLYVGNETCAETWSDKRSRVPKFDDLSHQRRSPIFTFQIGRNASRTPRRALWP
jgi:hypothetical protein